MKQFLLLFFIFLNSTAHAADEAWPEDLRTEQNKVEQLDRDAHAPGVNPQTTAAIERQRQESIGKIETIANTRPDNAEAHLAVGKTLASVSEAPRAVPFAERGLKLAEESRDPKMIRDALLVGSEVYYKAGNYDLARERAQRILKTNPKDKDALALYMQVKDRGAASSSSKKGGTTNANAGGASQIAQTASQATAAQTPRTPDVAMTSASSIEVQRQLDLGASRLKLDPKDALKHFDAAVAADPRNAKAWAKRAAARIEAREAQGALEDANRALALDPALGEAYAARAEAGRVLGETEAKILADYEAAAKLDGNFAEAYKALKIRFDSAAGASGNRPADAGSSVAPAQGGFNSVLSGSNAGKMRLGMFAGAGAVAGGLILLILKRRR